MFDRGPYVSFANCGLPYYVGNVISDESRLLVASREMFHERFNIEVQTETEVTSIDRSACTITVRDLRTGQHPHGALRCARAVAWRRADPTPAARRGLARRFRRAHDPGLPPHPFMDCRA